MWIFCETATGWVLWYCKSLLKIILYAMVVFERRGKIIMRIKDVIEKLSKYDPDIEVVVGVDGDFFSPNFKRDIVSYKHNYNGVSYKDEAIVLSN